MANRISTLGSPGVEVREYDNSQSISLSSAVTAYLTGFAAQGPVEEVMSVSDINEFVSIYGQPTNASERYFYHQAKAFLEGTGNGATLLTSRLPYGAGTSTDTKFTLLAYPKKKVKNTYFIGAPSVHYLTTSQYNDIVANGFEESNCTSIKTAAFVIINKANTIVNEDFEGYYIGITDNAFTSPKAQWEYKCGEDTVTVPEYNSITGVKTTTGSTFTSLNETRYGFDCDSNYAGSVSHTLERGVTQMDISGREYDDTISIGLFKLNKDTTNTANKLNYSVHEAFNGSLGARRTKTSQNATKAISYFVESVANESSNNMTVLVNSEISDAIKIGDDGKLTGKIRVYSSKLQEYVSHYASSGEMTCEQIEDIVGVSQDEFNCVIESGINTLNDLYQFGAYTKIDSEDKKIGNISYKLRRALELVENDEEYPDLDLVIDGGLSTIARAHGDNEFKDTNEDKCVDTLRTAKEVATSQAKDDYLSVIQTFLTFCNAQNAGGRGDSFFVGDILRGVFIKGKNTKVASLYGQEFKTGVNHSWSTSIYYPIKHLTDTIMTTYASLYAQWMKVVDDYSGQQVWVPASAYVAAKMAAADVNDGPWSAAAGLNRGVITGVIDYAINPTPSQRTDLYKICINSIPKLPNAGLTIWGIRTMSKRESAFQQNTARRTFLYMEKKVKAFLRYYVFEPNTSYTRLRLYNDVKPLLDNIVTNGGLYKYDLTCDETNNTPEVVNNGDMAIDIGASPTITGENIVLGVTCNKYTGETSVSN